MLFWRCPCRVVRRALTIVSVTDVIIEGGRVKSLQVQWRDAFARVAFQAVFRCLRIFPPLPGASDPGVVLKFILPLQELLLHCQLHNVAEIESSEVQCCRKIWSIPICILDPSHIFKGNEPTFQMSGHTARQVHGHVTRCSGCIRGRC